MNLIKQIWPTFGLIITLLFACVLMIQVLIPTSDAATDPDAESVPVLEAMAYTYYKRPDGKTSLEWITPLGLHCTRTHSGTLACAAISPVTHQIISTIRKQTQGKPQ